MYRSGKVLDEVFELRQPFHLTISMPPITRVAMPSGSFSDYSRAHPFSPLMVTDESFNARAFLLFTRVGGCTSDLRL